MSPTIHSLPPIASSPGDSSSLREQIITALRGDGHVTVPGDREEDRQWAYKRSVPTVVLYDEQGLRLYDKITSDAPEYYLFEDELNLLKNHGAEIARCMGFGKSSEKKEKRRNVLQPEKRWRPAKWGDTEVGKWNNGVNGEEGLGGGVNRGYDVVELGAGALRKTGYLLKSLAAAVPDSTTAPITYHPLDLSYPELDRVLGEMDEAFGDDLKGKVDCIGLHGDYDAGLQLIREGGLESLKVSTPSIPDLENDGATLSPVSSASIVTPEVSLKQLDSPPFDAEDDAPLPEACDPASSAIVEDTWFKHSNPPHQHTTTSPTPERPLHIVFLGSSLGNFDRASAAPFLKSLPLRHGDTLLLGLDGRPTGKGGAKKVEIAYNDPAGHTKAFEEHGWEIVRRELGLKGDPGVEFVGRYNETLGRHEAYFKSKERQTFNLPEGDITLEKGELLNIEWSYKYSLGEALELFKAAELQVVNSWKAPDSEYRLWLLERPSVNFTPHNDMTSGPIERAVSVPKWQDWTALWKLWDHITLEMIPREMLHQKPIDLRHICLFYLGHIPTFLDIYLTRLTNGKHTEPEKYKLIFERGIDPDVDDPTKVHSHSEVPSCEEDWPVLEEILDFRDRVRTRLQGIYDDIVSGQMELSRKAGRVLFMTYEHEGMHAETLLYMLAQSASTRPPTAAATPQWDILAKQWDEQAVKHPNKVLSIPGGQVIMGHNDLEAQDADYPTSKGWESHEFGWDNENPQIGVNVGPFKVDSLVITNDEYLAFLKSTDANFTNPESLPASWVQVDEEWKIRSLYGPLGFEIAGKWPLMASKIELEAYAKFKGGRLPTEPELRLLWESQEGPRPAGTLANVGFKHWHPIPPVNTITDSTGEPLYGHNGGVWEWTDTEFTGFPGYVASELYPGFSSDFFDGKHFVVIGGSFATIPSLAERKSWRNWYQANYRFSFIGGRVAYGESSTSHIM